MNLTDVVYNQYYIAFLQGNGENPPPTELRITEDDQTRITEDGQTRDVE